MAENILKLKVDSSSYDSKIKRAKDGLLAMESACRKVGGTFEVTEREELEFVRALGKMETQSKSARGKIGELTSAFTDLRTMFNRLSEDEKKSPFGQAMSKSLDELKGRIREGKKELEGINSEIGNGGNGLESLAQKFGLNASMLTKFGGAAAIASGALKVASDAFMSSESNVDEWGRTLEASKGVYESFVISLNNMNFSGFLDNIDNVIKRSKEAYDALDKLNTNETVRNPEVAKIQAEQTRLKAIIRRKGANSAEGKAATQQLKALEEPLKRAYMEQSKENYDVFVTAVRKKLAEDPSIKLSEKEFNTFLGTFSNSKAFANFQANAKGVKGLEYYNTVDQYGNTVQKKGPGDTRNKNQKLLDLFTDEWRKQHSPYLTAAWSSKNTSYQMELGNARYLKETAGGSRTSSSSSSSSKSSQKATQGVDLFDYSITNYKKLTSPGTSTIGSLGEVSQMISAFQQMMNTSAFGSEGFNFAKGGLADATTLQTLLQTSSKNGIDTGIDTSGLLSQMLEGDIPDDVWQNLADQINEKLAELNIEPISINFDTGDAKDIKKDGKQVGESWKDAAKAVQSVGSAMQNLEDPGAKIAGIVGQAIASIALGFASATAKDGPKLGVFGWIAAIAGGLGTMISTIAAIKSATAGSYAEGGIIPGNSISGDNLVANVNSGEVILNRAQQYNLAGQLQSTSILSNMTLDTVIGAEDIRVVLRNSNKRRGRKGESITI